ncbi:MAG: DUF4136 domain-containing protein [Bacteroidota bacterium]
MKAAIFIFALIALLGCGTQPQLSEVVNDMVVITNYKPAVDFSQLATYSLTMDTVGLQSNTTTQDALTNDYTKMITTQIKKNLDQSGHTQVTNDQDPDIGVNVLIVNDLSVSQSVVYPGGYYGGYYGYYGYGGGGYVTTNYFQQAVLIIELVDLKDSTPSNPISVWVANIGDLINSYDTSTKTKQAIDQAFVQSQYLDR